MEKVRGKGYAKGAEKVQNQKPKMKLTKLQKYTIYCIMLAEAEAPEEERVCYWGKSSTYSGLCKMSDILFDDYYLYYLYLHELSSKATINKGCYGLFHFSNWDERKEALRKSIEETHSDK